MKQRGNGIPYADRRDGRKGAKSITKHRLRAHERDYDHDAARRYNGGDKEMDEE